MSFVELYDDLTFLNKGLAFPTQSKKEDAKKFYLKVPFKVQKIIIHGNNFCPCKALIDKIHRHTYRDT